jgi:hypothetical protein
MDGGGQEWTIRPHAAEDDGIDAVLHREVVHLGDRVAKRERLIRQRHPLPRVGEHASNSPCNRSITSAMAP